VWFYTRTSRKLSVFFKRINWIVVYILHSTFVWLHLINATDNSAICNRNLISLPVDCTLLFVLKSLFGNKSNVCTWVLSLLNLIRRRMVTLACQKNGIHTWKNIWGWMRIPFVGPWVSGIFHISHACVFVRPILIARSQKLFIASGFRMVLLLTTSF
jgi:hypothetical protein